MRCEPCEILRIALIFGRVVREIAIAFIEHNNHQRRLLLTVNKNCLN